MLVDGLSCMIFSTSSSSCILYIRWPNVHVAWACLFLSNCDIPFETHVCKVSNLDINADTQYNQRISITETVYWVHITKLCNSKYMQFCCCFTVLVTYTSKCDNCSSVICLYDHSIEPPSIDHSNKKWYYHGHVVTLKVRRIWKQLYLYFQLHVISPTTSLSIMLELRIILYSNLLL
jgi:hypothetical protein